MKRKQAFTLVELLTVIGILALLVAILVPAVNSVRQAARKTVTSGVISTLSTGIEQFRADQTIGGKYPPSASDRVNNSGKLTYNVESPYTDLMTNRTKFKITGAGLLVWALAGADLLGPPGFKDLDEDGIWGNDTSNKKNTGGIYELDNNREPKYPRVASLVDLSNTKVTRFDSLNKSFTIPAEVKARKDMGQAIAQQPDRPYPVFLDAFDGPILYWRADRAGVRIADVTPTPNGATDPSLRGIYHFEDNGILLDGPRAVWMSTARNLFGSDVPHDLFLSSSAASDSDLMDPDFLKKNNERDYSFARVIQNLDVTARSEPQKPKSFLLLSAGPDGIFGTGDDIGNFTPNGR